MKALVVLLGWVAALAVCLNAHAKVEPRRTIVLQMMPSTDGAGAVSPVDSILRKMVLDGSTRIPPPVTPRFMRPGAGPRVSMMWAF